MDRKNSDAGLRRAEAWILDEKTRIKGLHYKYSRRLGKLSEKDIPKWIRALEVTEKKNYYFEIWYENGIKKSRYLGKEDIPVVQLVKEKRFLEEALAEIKKNEAFLEKCEKSLKRFDAERINESLPKSYRLSNEGLARVAGMSEEDQWYSEALKKKEREEKQRGYPRYGKIHVAKDGTCVQSKSELTIANLLIDRGIKYVYEMPMWIGGMKLHPDFVFYSHSRRKPIIWEHAGMLENDAYRRDFAERLDMYQSSGYAPCVDVIFSFDMADGGVDTRQLNKLIDEYL